jgi:hypothetical protein
MPQEEFALGWFEGLMVGGACIRENSLVLLCQDDVQIAIPLGVGAHIITKRGRFELKGKLENPNSDIVEPPKTLCQQEYVDPEGV